MQIETLLLPSDKVLPPVPPVDIAVVIDTLRFTTTACQALAAGATAVSIAAEVDEVRELASQHHGPKKLCGERHCRPIAGFDLGNSPLEYTSPVIRGNELFFTTTNGTRAVARAQHSGSIWLAGLVNRSAIAERLIQLAPARVAIICAGTDREVAFEDVLTAGAILDLMSDASLADRVRWIGDANRIALAAWQSAKNNPLVAQEAGDSFRERLVDAFTQTNGGRNLVETGYRADLDFAAQVDALDIVPRSDRLQWWRFLAR